MIVLLFIYAWGFQSDERVLSYSVFLQEEKKTRKSHSSLSAIDEWKLRKKKKIQIEIEKEKKGNSSINWFSFDQKRVTHSGEKGLAR